MDREPVEPLLAEEAPPLQQGLSLRRSEASLLSRFGFSYLDPLFKKGVRTPLQLVRISAWNLMLLMRN